MLLVPLCISLGGTRRTSGPHAAGGGVGTGEPQRDIVFLGAGEVSGQRQHVASAQQRATGPRRVLGLDAFPAH